MTGAVTSDARLGVVVVNYGSHALVEHNLGSLDLTGLDVLVVVVDNHHDDIERAAIERVSADHGWVLVALPDNRGFGAGVNAGVARAAELGCGAFLTLNPDVRVARDVVVELHRQVRRDPLALVSPRLLSPSGEVVFDGSRVARDSGRIRRVPAAPDVGHVEVLVPDVHAWPWLPATCLAVHGDLLAKVGGFDEPYFLYWEDVDLSVRCTEAGGRLVVRHDLAVVHDEGGTQRRRDQRALSSRYYYWNCRNRLLFGARHLPARAVARWVLRTPVESRRILYRGGRRQLLRSPAPLVSTVAGSLAGLVVVLRELVRPRPRPASPMP